MPGGYEATTKACEGESQLPNRARCILELRLGEYCFYPGFIFLPAPYFTITVAPSSSPLRCSGTTFKGRTIVDAQRGTTTTTTTIITVSSS